MKRPFVHTQFNIAWLAIFVSIFLATVFSPDRVLSLRHMFYFLSTSIPLFLAVNIIKSTGDLKLCAISLAVATGIRILTILYFEIGKMSSGFVYETAAHGSLPSYHAVLNMGIVFCFFILLGLIIEKSLKMSSIMIAGAITVLLVVVLLKLPRSSDLGLFAGMLTLLLLRRIRMVALTGLVILVLMIFILWPFLLQNTALGRFADFGSIESVISHQSMRMDAYRAAISMMKDHPIFGIGPGMWDDYYYRYMENRVVHKIAGIYTVFYVRGAHNIFLQQGATCGIAGLVSVMALFFLMFQKLVLIFKKYRHVVAEGLSIALLAVMSSLVVAFTLGGGQFEISRSPEEHYWFWLFVGLVAAAWNLTAKQITGGQCASPQDGKTV